MTTHQRISHLLPLKTLSFTLLLFSTILSSCVADHGWHKESGMVWNTIYNVTWEGSPTLADSILNALAPVDHSLSVFNDSSLVSKVNNSISTPVDIHFKTIFRECVRVNHASGGMFDPTLSPAITAWGFGKGHHATPDTLRLDSLCNIVGIGKTHLEGDILRKDDIRTQFNFSALAKGYGVDLVADMFRRNGVNNFLVEIGGEIVCSGVNDKGKPWNIAIDSPRQGALPGEEIADVISLSGMGMATSGNYRNFHESGGKSYGHTISPVDCRPVTTDVISATVIAPTCMEADALATACMAVGRKKAIAMCDSLGRAVMLISPDFTIYQSESFKQLQRK